MPIEVWSMLAIFVIWLTIALAFANEQVNLIINTSVPTDVVDKPRNYS